MSVIYKDAGGERSWAGRDLGYQPLPLVGNHVASACHVTWHAPERWFTHIDCLVLGGKVSRRSIPLSGRHGDCSAPLNPHVRVGMTVGRARNLQRSDGASRLGNIRTVFVQRSVCRLMKKTWSTNNCYRYPCDIVHYSIEVELAGTLTDSQLDHMIVPPLLGTINRRPKLQYSTSMRRMNMSSTNICIGRLRATAARRAPPPSETFLEVETHWPPKIVKAWTLETNSLHIHS